MSSSPTGNRRKQNERNNKADDDDYQQEEDKNMLLTQKYICIHCCAPSATLYRQFNVSLSSIQTTSCTNCQKLVDPYCEREWLLLVIDCILLREEAYRHVLFNLEDLYRLLTVHKCLQFAFAWSVVDTYLKWETLAEVNEGQSDGIIVGGSTNNKNHTSLLLLSLGITSMVGMLCQLMVIFMLCISYYSSSSSRRR